MITKMTTTGRQIERGMSTIKLMKKIIGVVICLTALILTALPMTAQAADRYLVTILLIPDKSFEYTDYDSAYLTIVNNHTGQSYSYTLYPYNNFSDKVWLDKGTYSVLDVGMNGRADMIFESESEDIVVDRATAIVVNFGDSKIIKQNTTTATTTKKTTTEITQTTKPESPTLFPIITGEYSTTLEDTSQNTSTSYLKTTEPAETTTADTEENPIKEHPYMIPAITVTVLVAIICIVFFILLQKKNKAEE